MSAHKDLSLEAKIASIKKKEEEILRRRKEIEEDIKLAKEQNAMVNTRFTISNTSRKRTPALKPSNRKSKENFTDNSSTEPEVQRIPRRALNHRRESETQRISREDFKGRDMKEPEVQRIPRRALNHRRESETQRISREDFKGREMKTYNGPPDPKSFLFDDERYNHPKNWETSDQCRRGDERKDVRDVFDKDENPRELKRGGNKRVGIEIWKRGRGRISQSGEVLRAERVKRDEENTQREKTANGRGHRVRCNKKITQEYLDKLALYSNQSHSAHLGQRGSHIQNYDQVIIPHVRGRGRFDSAMLAVPLESFKIDLPSKVITPLSVSDSALTEDTISCQKQEIAKGFTAVNPSTPTEQYKMESPCFIDWVGDSLPISVPKSMETVGQLDMALLIGQALPVAIIRVEENFTIFIQPLAGNPEMQSLVRGDDGIRCCLSVKEDASEEKHALWSQQTPVTYVTAVVDAVLPDSLQVIIYDTEGQLVPPQNSETTELDKVCPLPILTSHHKVTIAHAGEEGIFLHKTSYTDALADLQQQLYEVYNNSENIGEKWTPGQFCCALCVNSKEWYRAKVLVVWYDLIEVRYIDYGKNEVLQASCLRKLNPMFYTPPAYALSIYFHLTWKVHLRMLLELAGDTEYNAVLFKGSNGWIAELVDNSGQSLTEKLIELGFADALDGSPFKGVVSGKFESGKFIRGSNVIVSVSSIDSPQQVWIQNNDDIHKINALQDTLQKAVAKLHHLQEPSGIFAAKLSSDGLWYRAVQLNGSTVRFIDYGNTHDVEISDVKTLFPVFLKPAEGYAVKVELPVREFKEGATERLEQLLIASEKTEIEEDIRANVLLVKEMCIIADIYKGNESVVDILVAEGLASRLQNVLSGFICNINALNDFFIHEVGCEDDLWAIRKIMLTYKQFKNIDQINEGDIVAAFCNNDRIWYRAKVLKAIVNSIVVLFIDYGVSAEVTDVKALPTDLVRKPALAQHYSLQLPNGVVEWSQAANEKFVDISAGGCTKFDIKVLNQQDPPTVMLFYGGNSLTEELGQLCEIVQEVPTTNPGAILTGYDQAVYISHINNPLDFYVQFDGAVNMLDAIKEELTDTSSFKIIEQITEKIKGTIIGAFFVKNEIWYRAKVLNITEDGAEVLFIDYGNTTSATKFIELPDSLLNKPALAMHCALRGGNWPEEVVDYFNELSGGGTVLFMIKFIDESDRKIVSLLVDNKLVEDKINEKFGLLNNKTENHINTLTIPVKTQETKDDISLIKTVFCIHVNSPSDFYLQTTEAKQLVVEISKKLVEAESFPSIDEDKLDKDRIVAVQLYENDSWYRAKVIEHSSGEIKAFCIDYGNTAKVVKVKQLPEELIDTPPLAMHCSLQKLNKSEWPPNACVNFYKLINDDGVSFDFKMLTEGDPKEVILYLNGQSIAEQLLLADILITKEAQGNTQLNVNLDVTQSYVINSEPGDLQNTRSQSQFKLGLTCNNPSDFYVQDCDEERELEKIPEENFEVMSYTDEVLATKCTTDELWYRPKIIDTTSAGREILSEEILELEKYFLNMILDSIDKTLTNNLNMDVKTFIDELINKVVNSSEGENEQCFCDTEFKSDSETFKPEDETVDFNSHVKEEERHTAPNINDIIISEELTEELTEETHNLNMDVKTFIDELINKVVNSSEGENEQCFCDTEFKSDSDTFKPEDETVDFNSHVKEEERHTAPNINDIIISEELTEETHNSNMDVKTFIDELINKVVNSSEGENEQCFCDTEFKSDSDTFKPEDETVDFNSHVKEEEKHTAPNINDIIISEELTEETHNSNSPSLINNNDGLDLN